ncbi:hypothetical protein [Ruegeria sp. HKCCD7221]|uniref:hypothetical protein n=1 Tax=Ruegeria sp. HKCCD7221 TaxID=2683009 RepID=UPI0014885885|nr:hypothetical protein [Ruegeria sp. HKCCD7221]
MNTKLIFAVLSGLVLVACGSTGNNSRANLEDAGWLLVDKTVDDAEFYLRKSNEPGTIYWIARRSQTREFVTKTEYDCRNSRFRDLTATLDRMSGMQVPNRYKDWTPFSNLVPDSVPAYIAEMVCSGRIVRYTGV